MNKISFFLFVSLLVACSSREAAVTFDGGSDAAISTTDGAVTTDRGATPDTSVAADAGRDAGADASPARDAAVDSARTDVLVIADARRDTAVTSDVFVPDGGFVSVDGAVGDASPVGTLPLNPGVCAAPPVITVAGTYTGTTCGGGSNHRTECATAQGVEGLVRVEAAGRASRRLRISEGFLIQQITGCSPDEFSCGGGTYEVSGTMATAGGWVVAIERTDGHCGEFTLNLE